MLGEVHPGVDATGAEHPLYTYPQRTRVYTPISEANPPQTLYAMHCM
jgi:hypothetical protein